MAKKIDVKDALKNLEIEILELSKNPLSVLGYLKNAPMGEVTAFFAHSGATYPILDTVHKDAQLGHNKREQYRRGGKARAEQRRSEAADRHQKICDDAAMLAALGYDEREIPGRTARRKGLTTRQVRNILRDQSKKGGNKP